MSTGQLLARGDIVLVLFPFTDLSAQRVRPALVAGRVNGDDVILAFITSQVFSLDPQTAHLLHPSDPDFQRTGLKVPSLIRLDKLATLHRGLVRRRIGAIGAETERGIARCLRNVFEL